MQIITELTEIPNLSLALGFFDGMHIGHQAVIGCAVEYAKENNLKSAVVTFSKHPRCYTTSKFSKYLFPKEDRYSLMDDYGVDYIVELDFPSVENMTPEQYLRDILVKYFTPKAISTGFNHHFGNKRLGGVKFLSDHQDVYNYIYFATPPQMLYGDVISSSAIKEFIHSGTMFMANDMLGRKFSVIGEVVEGEKIGRTIGFPTANIIYPQSIIEPAFGVYKTEVALANGEKFPAIANFGVKPTVSESNEKILEVHIPNFNRDLYGQNIEVRFVKRIRQEIKFPNLEALKAQIAMDLQELRK